MKKLKNLFYKVIDWCFDTNLGFIVFLAVIIIIISICWDIYWDNVYNN